MKNKQGNTVYLNQQNQNKQSFYKKRDQHHRNRQYHNNYKQNLTQSNYYDKGYWKDNNFEYQNYNENLSFRGPDPRPFYKKNTWYKNYKNRNGVDYEADDDFQYNPHYSERSHSPMNRFGVAPLIEKKMKDKKENELLAIKIYLAGQYKNIRIYKDEDIPTTVNKFCIENNLDKNISKALCEKINSSLKIIDDFKKGVLNDKNSEIVNKIRKLYENKDNNYSYGCTNENS